MMDSIYFVICNKNNIFSQNQILEFNFYFLKSKYVANVNYNTK